MKEQKPIIFENENARILFEDVRDKFKSLDLDKYAEQELTEEMALSMYYHACQDKVPVVQNTVYVPVYNLEVV